MSFNLSNVKNAIELQNKRKQAAEFARDAKTTAVINEFNTFINSDEFDTKLERLLVNELINDRDMKLYFTIPNKFKNYCILALSTLDIQIELKYNNNTDKILFMTDKIPVEAYDKPEMQESIYKALLSSNYLTIAQECYKILENKLNSLGLKFRDEMPNFEKDIKVYIDFNEDKGEYVSYALYIELL